MDLLVSTEWLANELGASDLRVVDATYLAPDDTRDAAREYEEGHVPGAVFMDLANLRDSGSDLPMMVPPPEKFASRMQSLGLGDGSRIVLYDNSSMHTAARAWWMLQLFGAHNVAILDGGLAKWRAEDRPLASGKENQRHRHFTVFSDPAWIRTKAQLLANLDSHDEQVVDARSHALFTGEQPATDPAIQPGHIPGARNVPANSLFESAEGKHSHVWLKPDAIAKKFSDAGADPHKPMVMTCGTGITACVLAFGASLAGVPRVAVYDASWAEWGRDLETPKETGEAR